jgi:hypothetical protein
MQPPIEAIGRGSEEAAGHGGEDDSQPGQRDHAPELKEKRQGYDRPDQQQGAAGRRPGVPQQEDRSDPRGQGQSILPHGEKQHRAPGEKPKGQAGGRGRRGAIGCHGERRDHPSRTIRPAARADSHDRRHYFRTARRRGESAGGACSGIGRLARLVGGLLSPMTPGRTRQVQPRAHLF